MIVKINIIFETKLIFILDSIFMGMTILVFFEEIHQKI